MKASVKRIFFGIAVMISVIIAFHIFLAAIFPYRIYALIASGALSAALGGFIARERFVAPAITVAILTWGTFLYFDVVSRSEIYPSKPFEISGAHFLEFSGLFAAVIVGALVGQFLARESKV